jgi:hypothetical protein
MTMLPGVYLHLDAGASLDDAVRTFSDALHTTSGAAHDLESRMWIAIAGVGSPPQLLSMMVKLTVLSSRQPDLEEALWG